MESEYDMEVTPEREQAIKERLMMLYEDQMGQKFIWTVTPIENTEEPA